MTRFTGPSVTHMTHRLARCPSEYLGEPKIGDEEGVFVDALVADLVLALGAALPRHDELEAFRTNTHLHRKHLRLVQVGVWLLSDPELRKSWADEESEEIASKARVWLARALFDLAELVDPADFVTEAERREELCRSALYALDILPHGETEEVAEDRLKMLDSVERHRVIMETQERVKRAEQLRKKMAEKRAREAAARYTRE